MKIYHKENFFYMRVLSALAAISELIDIQSVLETARISAQKKELFTNQLCEIKFD